MTLKICQLSDKLRSLAWGKSEFVNCGEFYTADKLNVKCCLCSQQLKASDFENSHALIGGLKEKVEEWICKVHYLCRNCKKQCSICGGN